MKTRIKVVTKLNGILYVPQYRILLKWVNFSDIWDHTVYYTSLAGAKAYIDDQLAKENNSKIVAIEYIKYP